jgi:small-conductance mechanosensitive channel
MSPALDPSRTARRGMWKVTVALILAWFFCGSFSGHATTALAAPGQAIPASPQRDTIREGDVSTGEGRVAIDDDPADAKIQTRLDDILTATDRFTDLTIEVRDGVVFLTGQTDREEMRTLAVELAKRTEGVAAVVNNIEIRQDPNWSLAPARAELARLTREMIRALPLVLIAVVLLAVFYFSARLVGRVVGRLASRATDSVILCNAVRKAAVLLVMIFGIYLALRVTGLSRIALAIVSGTGLMGLVLGFAFRDIAENFLASILLSIQRPFRIGDVIEVDGHTGVVRKVTSRGTLLIDFDGNHIQIANSTVYKSTIKNLTANPKMRLNFTVGIGYDANLTVAQNVARRVLLSHPAVFDDPEPLVLVETLGSSTVVVRVYFWIDITRYSMLKVQSAVMRLVLKELTSAGISMPDDAREVIFPNGVPVRMLDARSMESGVSGATMAEKELRDKVVAAESESGASAVAAEDNLTTEVHELKRQADAARDPGSGENVRQPTPPGS